MCLVCDPYGGKGVVMMVVSFDEQIPVPCHACKVAGRLKPPNSPPHLLPDLEGYKSPPFPNIACTYCGQRLKVPLEEDASTLAREVRDEAGWLLYPEGKYIGCCPNCLPQFFAEDKARNCRRDNELSADSRYCKECWRWRYPTNRCSRFRDGGKVLRRDMDTKTGWVST